MGIVKDCAGFAAPCWTRRVSREAVHGWGQFGLSTAGYWEPLVSSLAVVAVGNPGKLSPVVDSGTIPAGTTRRETLSFPPAAWHVATVPRKRATGPTRQDAPGS
jgi:hypothetical protein